MRTRSDYGCIVVGGGPSGLAAAAALAFVGVDVTVAMPESQASALHVDRHDALPGDTRTAALFPPAIAMLKRLGAWDGLAELSAPLAAIRIVDATGRLLRAPEVVFRASDIGLADLGFNVPNAALTRALFGAAQALGVTVLSDSTALSSREDSSVRCVELSGGRNVRAPLVVGADGRGSMMREAAGISTSRWSYDQAALATRFSHSRPHSGISTELSGAQGPCTTVPLAEGVSSLVWMDRPDVVQALAAAPADDFLRHLAKRLDGLLGTLSDPGPRRVFPLAGLIASTMGKARVALVGEAGHAMPPIGAQGLNLALSDIAVLADLVGDQARRGGDTGGIDVLAAYDRARNGDVHRRVTAVDLLNRSVQPSLWPLGLARGAGLHVLAAMPSLRRRLMREGLFPPPPLPTLMAAAGGKVTALHPPA